MGIHHRFRAWGLVAAVVLAGGAGVRAAGPLDNKVPQDAVLYAGWAGADALKPAYDQSNLKAILEASTIKDFINAQLPKLMQQANAQDAKASEQIAKLQNGLGIAWRHPVAFYMEPVDFTDPKQPGVHFGLICDAGRDAKALTDLINGAMQDAPPTPPEMPITVSADGTLVKITFGKPTAVSGFLPANPNYVAAMKHVNVNMPAVAFYADVQKGVAMVNEALEKIPDAPPEVKEKAGIVIDALGFNGMRQIAMQSGFDGKGWTDQAFVGYAGEKKGIAGLASGTPISDATLAAVPQDAAAFSAGSMDLHKLFTEMRTVIGKVDQNAGQSFDEAMTQGNQALGIDIEKDFLSPLGNQWVIYRAPLSEEGGNSTVFVSKLSDGEHFSKTLSTLEAFAAKAAQDRFKIDHVTTGKIEVSSVSYLTYSVAWTVRNGYLYVSSLDGIAGAVKQVENKKPSIVASELYKKAIAPLPKGIEPIAISYANPAKLYPEVRRTLLGIIPLARAAGVDIPPSILPDSDDVALFMTPGASMSWWDADGMHASGHTAFPGADMFSGNPRNAVLVALPAGFMAVALPRVAMAQRARPMPAVAVPMPPAGMP